MITIKNKSLFLLMLAVSLATMSCEKAQTERKLVYSIKGFSEPYKLVYKNPEGKDISEKIVPANSDWEWKKTFIAEKYDMVYIYVNYKEMGLDKSKKLKIRIFVDGKIYKEAYNHDRIDLSDTSFVIIRSGLIK